MLLNSHNFSTEIETLKNVAISQFVSRTTIEGKNTGKDFREASITAVLRDKTLWFTITTLDGVFNITIPMPYLENSIIYIKSNEVKRAVCEHFDVKADRIITYLNAIQSILIGNFDGIVHNPGNKKVVFIQQLAYSILNNNTPIIVRSLQKTINELVNKMPLHETDMNSWMMNHKLILVDTAFEMIDNPTDRLEYQVEKNRCYFDRGWTSIGLSDGSLADKNYILMKDLRNFTAFGLHHHNPQRNLYSTLGMKGDEYPRLRTKSYQELMDKGITRKGWNWFTAFVDIPDNFEDQIVVDIRHADKFILRERRFQFFGTMLIKPGQRIKLGTPISQSPDGVRELCTIKADEIYVKRIVKGKTAIGGNLKEVYNVVIGFKRYLKDGTKVTNTHGNKGVIRLMDLGYAIDPKTGEKRHLDLIVSAKSVKKRKNHGQIVELLMNNLFENRPRTKKMQYKSKSRWDVAGRNMGHVGSYATGITEIEPVVFLDNYAVNEKSMSIIKAELATYGYNNQCTWKCDTYAGKIDAVCGTVFWGVSKDVEDQLWDKGATTRTNGKDLRTAGLKFSTVEFKALETRFGKNNAIIKEVLSYTQGTEQIEETFKALRSKMYQFPENIPVLLTHKVNEVDQTGGTIFNKKELINTIADEFYYQNGLIIKLPVMYQTAVGHNSNDTYEGPVMYTSDSIDWQKFKSLYNTDQIYIPAGNMRRNWRHGSGLYGMSEVAVLVNNIVVFAKRMIEEPEEPRHIRMMYKAISNYYNKMATTLSTKKGAISNLALSVRYPYSAKAVATLSTKLPPNTVQIHRDMAEILEVKNNDVVIVERFPCLGFMSIRPQQILITDDPLCKYTIRASNNSLVSTNLDHDGDVLYLASFHTPEACALLHKEWETPNENCWAHIDQLNTRKGAPSINCLNLSEYEIKPFPIMTKEAQAAIVSKLTGVKAQTGPVIALTYNIMRIMENSGVEVTRKTEAGIEMFIEKAGQSVFQQKHGGQSLHEIVIDGVCTGNANILIKEGFDPEISHFICNVIKTKAGNIGIRDLVDFHERFGKEGSNVINRIVRKENKIYFASRSNLEACTLLECLAAPVVDLPSKIFSLTMTGKYNNGRTVLDVATDTKLINFLKDDGFKAAAAELFKCVNSTIGINAGAKPYHPKSKMKKCSGACS
jgi:hypothetical protein